MECPECGGELVIDLVEQRERRRCHACGYFSYGERPARSSDQHVLDDIADKVAAEGEQTVPWVSLINGAFRADAAKSSQQKLKQWCALHDFACEVLEFRGGGTKPQM